MSEVGKRFTAAAMDRRIVPVSCDKCQTAYSYELVRLGQGSSSLFDFNPENAKRRATARAQSILAQRLEREAELVPCPKCNWINIALVDGYRRSRYRRLPILGIVLGVGAWFAVFLFMCGDGSISHAPTYSYRIGLTISTAAAMACAAGGYLLRWSIRRRVNPNCNFPAAPVLPPGTPKALIDESSPSPAAPSTAGAKLSFDASEFPMWVVLRLDYLIFPKACCECLGTPTTEYRDMYWIDTAITGLNVPLCAKCSSRIKFRWWGAHLLGIAGVALVAGLIYILGPGDDRARGFAACIFGAAGLGLAMAEFPKRAARPYTVRAIDGPRSIFRIKFRNARYTDMVRQAANDLEHPTPPSLPSAES